MGLDELRAARAAAASGDATVSKETLDNIERKTVPGVNLRTPRQRLLDARDVQARHPDMHIRWVNIKDPEKAEARKEDGYKRLTSEEGGRQIGDQAALFGIPKEQAEAKIRDMKTEHLARLDAHKAEMRRAAEDGARNLRDNHGLSVSADKLLISEES